VPCTCSARLCPLLIMILLMQINLTGALDFEGQEQIGVHVIEATDTITMHALELYIIEARFTSEKGAQRSLRSYTISPHDQTLSIHFDGIIPADTRGQIYIRFHGTMNESMCGLYHSTYMVGNERRIMAVTQFEATDARRAVSFASQRSPSRPPAALLFSPFSFFLHSTVPLLGRA
jgi:aminopeptidase N